MLTCTAPNLASYHFDDAQEQASALTGWNQNYLQLSSGSFHGEISQLHGTEIHLFIEQMQQSVFQTGELSSDVLAVGVPLEAEGTGVFCGKVCASNSFHVFSGQSGFEFRSSRKHTMLGIELKLGDMPKGSELLADAHSLSLEPTVLSGVRDYLLSLFRAAKQNPSLLSTPAVKSVVSDYLLDRMTQFEQADEFHKEICAHWKLVQKACTITNEQCDVPPTVAQLCQNLGVSRRTLQNGFQHVLDVSPLSYLKAVRLGRARTLLKSAHSVTEAATACGFWHFGHFSRDYHLMFGELPSTTLRASLND